MTCTPPTSSRVISVAFMVVALLMTAVSVSFSACDSEDACTNLREVCPGMSDATCVSTLADQAQEVIDCVYSASTCKEAYDCFGYDGEE